MNFPLPCLPQCHVNCTCSVLFNWGYFIMYNALYHFGSRWYSLHVALSAFIFLISWLPCFWTGHSKSIIYFAFCSNFMRLRSTIYMSVCNFVYRQHSTAFTLTTHSTGRLPGNGMRHLAIISRGLRGRTTPFYLVFAFPLNRSLFVTIVLYIADEHAGFTEDTDSLALCCTFLYRQTLQFRMVDTPSLASEASDGSI